MRVELYRTSVDPTTVSKAATLVSIATLMEVHPLDAQNIEEPELVLGSQDLATLKGVNYAYIPDWSRYYFVEPLIIRGKLYILPLKEDYLMSWHDYIINLVGVVERQENNYNLYLDDPLTKVNAYTQKKTLPFPSNGLTKNGGFILTVSGGKTGHDPTPSGGGEGGIGVLDPETGGGGAG